jgi:hypothetical protein
MEDHEPTKEGRTRPEATLMHAHLPNAPIPAATTMRLQGWTEDRRIL